MTMLFDSAFQNKLIGDRPNTNAMTVCTQGCDLFRRIEQQRNTVQQRER